MARQLSQPVADPALAALRAAPADQPVALLHSGRRHTRWATRSLLAQPRAWFRYTADHRSELFDAATGEPLTASRHLTHHLWPDLRSLLNDPRFPGKWIGYLSYDLGHLIEPVKLPPHRNAHDNISSAWPLVELAWCPDLQEFPASETLEGPEPNRESHSPNRKSKIENLKSNLSRPQYESAVRRVLDYIAAGDIFQANLAQRFTCDFTDSPGSPGSPRALFHRLAALSPAWYGAYLELPPNQKSEITNQQSRSLLSTSPELFLEVRGRDITTRPIKGTRPASVPIEELRDSEKDAAELNMIVDLMRNDLGRVCSYGSVRVPHPREIESHPTVHHTTATITGRLHESKDIIDLLRATLPGGSVTGAPKVRAMQIINELEPHPRGPYCGCIGYLSKDDACLNLAIRTILLTPQAVTQHSQVAGLPTPHSPPQTPHFTASFSVGGGIVADSHPAAEYEETLTKARAMMQALGINDNVKP